MCQIVLIEAEYVWTAWDNFSLSGFLLTCKVRLMRIEQERFTGFTQRKSCDDKWQASQHLYNKVFVEDGESSPQIPAISQNMRSVSWEYVR